VDNVSSPFLLTHNGDLDRTISSSLSCFLKHSLSVLKGRLAFSRREPAQG
jgi:hypothetical protein